MQQLPNVSVSSQSVKILLRGVVLPFTVNHDATVVYSVCLHSTYLPESKHMKKTI
jgi:hypothetical protein